MTEKIQKIIEYIKNDNLDKAYELSDVISNKEDEHIINNIKGVILFKKQKLDSAKKFFLKSIRINKNFIDPHKNLFKLNLKLQDYESAIYNAKKIIDLDDQKKSISYFNLALAYDLNKDYNQAIELYKIVETLNFNEKKILFNNLAKCFLATENINEAKNYYSKALEFDENDKFIINNLLILYLRIGDKFKIEQFYRKAENIDKDYIEFKLNSSDYLLSKEKIKEAIELLESIINDTKNFVAYTKLAKIFSMIGDYKKAKEIIDEAINIYPNSKDLKFTKGMYHLTLGEFEKGWELYEFRNSIIRDKSFKNIKIWNGEDLKNSSLLVTREQGMGDVLQFSKFLLNLSPLCKKIDFVIYSKLLPIFKKKYKNINICNRSEILKNEYDYKISVGSLNKYFYKENISYSSNLINFSEERREHWRSVLDNKKKI